MVQETNFGWFYVDKHLAPTYYTKLLSDKTRQKVCPGAEPFLDEDTGQVLGLRFHRSHFPVLGSEAPQSSSVRPVQWPSVVHEHIRDYQRRAAEFIGAREGAILADDLGLGKTLSSLAASEAPLLVCCPLSVLDVWHTEIEEWLGWKTLVVRSRKSFEEQSKRELWQTYKAVVLPYSQTGCAGYFATSGVVGPPHTLICDEGHMLTNKGVTWGQNLRLVQPSGRKVLLTATPLRNGLQSLWGLLDFVNPKAWGTRSEFLTRYMGAKPHRFAPLAVEPTEPTEQEELAARLGEVILKRSRNDVNVSMPKHVRHLWPVEVATRELARAATGQSHSLKKDKGAQTLQVVNALRKSIGRLKNEGGWPQLAEFVRGHRAVVWLWHKEVAQAAARLFKEAGHVVDVMTGESPTKDRSRILKEWSDPNMTSSRILVATIAAGCTGISLKNCDRAVFVEIDWSPVTVMQAEKRHHRPGNVYSQVETAYMIASFQGRPLSIDEQMLKALDRKVEASEGALGRDSQREQIEAMLGEPLHDKPDCAAVMRDFGNWYDDDDDDDDDDDGIEWSQLGDIFK